MDNSCLVTAGLPPRKESLARVVTPQLHPAILVIYYVFLFCDFCWNFSVFASNVIPMVILHSPQLEDIIQAKVTAMYKNTDNA